jgi:hypothetical protein
MARQSENSAAKKGGIGELPSGPKPEVIPSGQELEFSPDAQSLEPDLAAMSQRPLAAAKSDDNQSKQMPLIARSVHYVMLGHGHPHRPAVIVDVHAGESCDLQVFSNGTRERQGEQGILSRHYVKHDESKTPGTWHWPERA